MIKHRKHIALLLLVFFIFPILFQSIHIVSHHSADYKSECHLHKKETSGNDLFIVIKKATHELDVCPICEYQFSINNLLEISVPSLIIPVNKNSYTAITLQQYYRKNYTRKSPRAPPFIAWKNNSRQVFRFLNLNYFNMSKFFMLLLGMSIFYSFSYSGSAARRGLFVMS